MAARKLQQEVDKCFKKVEEGVVEFETIYEKIEQSNNPAQKEKLEDQLKREIKKLQRLRDQIKTWASSNDIKDKGPLLDKRKLIETQMEKFKAVEKAMKTKAYSKEGLSAAAKLDPKEQAKIECVEFLGTMIDELELQIEQVEAESENIQATMKKGKKQGVQAQRVAEIERVIDRHKWHQSKLELIKRSLENGGVDTDQVNELQDDIRYYVSDGMSSDYQENEELYDELNLDEEEDVFGMVPENDKGSSQDNQSVQDDFAETVASVENTATASASASTAPVRPPKATRNPVPEAPTSRRPSAPIGTGAGAGAGAGASSTLHNPPLATISTGNGTSSSAYPSMKPATLPARPAGEGLKYASAAAAAAAAAASSDRNLGIAPLPPPPGSTISPLPPIQNVRTNATSAANSPSIPSIQLVQPIQPILASADRDRDRDRDRERDWERESRPELSSSAANPTTAAQAASFLPPASLKKAEKASERAVLKSSSAKTSQATAAATATATEPIEASSSSSSSKPEPSSRASKANGTSSTASNANGFKTGESSSSSKEKEKADRGQKARDKAKEQQPRHQPDKSAEEIESVYHLPATLSDLIESLDATARHPLPANSAAHLRMLQISQASAPVPADADAPRPVLRDPRFVCPHYPQEQLSVIFDPRFYTRVDSDMLFYIFYYKQGSYQQYLAAKALKDQSWRFHKQYQTWFQRHEEPKNITEEFEQGTYRFFDYESTWMNRRKGDFKFTYKYLEDEV